MKDIFKPGELKQNTINIKKKPQLNTYTKSEQKTVKDNIKKQRDIKSSLVITNNKNLISSKTILTFLIIIFIILGSFMAYYFFKLNKIDDNVVSDTQKGNEDIDKFEDNLNKIESSSKDLDSDSQDIEPSTIDFNVNL